MSTADRWQTPDLNVAPEEAPRSNTAPILVVDDDDEVQVCSPRSFAQANGKRNRPSHIEVVNKTRTSRKRANSNGRQHRQKRIHPTPTIDLTLSTNEDCEVVSEKKAKPAEPESKEVKLTCGICFETMKNETSTVCGHIFCAGCILSAIKVQKKCPTCRRKLTNSMVHRIYLSGSA